jgi:LysR family hydrogen peroxide-inducible transcriptional activator
MRSQILNFCELKKQHEVTEKLHYEAGSIETLKNLVEKNFGVTIIPELATFNLTKTQQKRLRYFKPPFPVREISLVTHREYIKFRLIEVLKETILTVIPEGMKKQHKMNVLEI